MAREYQFNHTLSRKQIDFWADQSVSPPVVYAYLIERDRKLCARAVGDHRYSFAAGTELYTAAVEGVRSTAAEQWFAKLEGALVPLLRQAARREEIGPTEDLYAAMMAIVGCELRSRYQLRMVREAIERDAALRAACSANPERPPELLAIENLAHAINEIASRNWPPCLEFIHVDVDLVLSDRPFFNEEGLSKRFVVLTKRVVVAYSPSPSGAPMYRHRDLPSDFARIVNQAVVNNAREWIVAGSQAQLEEFIPIFSSPEWQANREKDNAYGERVRALASGLSLRPKALKRGAGASGPGSP
jgi:hypothetical protein